MKFTRKNAGIGFRALVRQGWHLSFLKHVAAKMLAEAYEEDVRSRSSIRTLSPNDPRISYHGDITLSYEGKAGNTSLLEQYLLVTLAKKFNVQTLFEIGTFDGQTALSLAKNCPALQIYTLDLPIEKIDNTALSISTGERRYIEKPTVGSRFQGTLEAARITQLLGDSAALNYTPYDGKMDMIFIDGCHDAAYVKSDTEKALALRSPHGIILWHDYMTYDSVTRVLEEYGKTLSLFHIQGTSLVMHFSVLRIAE